MATKIMEENSPKNKESIARFDACVKSQHDWVRLWTLLCRSLRDSNDFQVAEADLIFEGFESAAKPSGVVNAEATGPTGGALVQFDSQDPRPQSAQAGQPLALRRQIHMDLSELFFFTSEEAAEKKLLKHSPDAKQLGVEPGMPTMRTGYLSTDLRKF